ncbi:MAG TPA: hypothetical protein VK564_11810 [Thermodesulfobacteriota bacterium]|nr:hypothetical protein [Thermodesulfobacteriota bacterium]
MEKYEEKIIDLVDVIAEPEAGRLPEKAPINDLAEKTEIKVASSPAVAPVMPTEEKSKPLSSPEPADFEKLVHMEVEQNLRTMIEEYFKKESGLDQMVKQEVERSLRSMIGEHIQSMVKEVLAQEVQKAIAREIEGLKKTN